MGGRRSDVIRIGICNKTLDIVIPTLQTKLLHQIYTTHRMNQGLYQNNKRKEILGIWEMMN